MNHLIISVLLLLVLLQVIQWMKNPTPNSQMGSFQEWNKCEVGITS